LTGNGIIEANGGSGERSGGGGRIAVLYTTWDSLATIQTIGGTAGSQGENGTLNIEPK